MATDVPPPEPQVWLMVNDVPAGPFTRAVVHAKLAAGEVTWQSPTCRLGTSSWLPLERVTEISSPPDSPLSVLSMPGGPDPACRARFQSVLQIGFPLVFGVLIAYGLYTNPNSGWTGPVERVFKATGGGLLAGVVFGGIPSALIGGSALGWQIAILTTAIGGVMELCIETEMSFLATLNGIIFGLWGGAVVSKVQAVARWWVAKWPGRPPPPPKLLTARTKRFGTWPVAGAIAACIGALLLVSFYMTNSGRTSTLPAAYQPYYPRGRLVPTGSASLDYWLHANADLWLVESQVMGMEEYHQSHLLRVFAGKFRKLPVTGVDPDLSAWAGRVSDLLEVRAAIVGRETDSKAVAPPATPPLGEGGPKQQMSGWKRDHDRLAREGQALRDDLSRRHGREFPRCLLGTTDVQPTAP